MDHTEGVTRAEEGEGANGIGGGIEVGCRINYGNGVGVEDGDSVHMDHTEDVTRTEKRKGANGIGGGI